MSDCPLCGARSSQFYEDKKRRYLQCEHCKLVFVPKIFHLNQNEEKTEYDKHQNSPKDKGYRDFLARIVEPLRARLDASAVGLDFGCGPGPTLAVMFHEAGYRVANYDPLYFPDTAALKNQYDFVCATEVWEHLRTPRETLEQLWACLKPGGHLGVMTKLVIDVDAFSRWHYKNDPTHIVFFSRPTLKFLAKKWHADLEYLAGDAFIFVKNKPV